MRRGYFSQQESIEPQIRQPMTQIHTDRDDTGSGVESLQIRCFSPPETLRLSHHVRQRAVRER